jgi:hypothetical protein
VQQTLFFGVYGLSFAIKGAPGLRFNFFSKLKRNTILDSLVTGIERSRSGHSKADEERHPKGHSTVSSVSSMDQVRLYKDIDYHSLPPRALHSMPKLINAEESRSPAPLRIFCMTIGSRGDVGAFVDRLGIVALNILRAGSTLRRVM